METFSLFYLKHSQLLKLQVLSSTLVGVFGQGTDVLQPREILE